MLGIIVILFLFNENSSSVYYWTIQNGLLFVANIFSLTSGVNYLIKIYKPQKNIN
jgi:phosphatidylglycerophosphate synthase